MATQRHGQIIETPTEARQAEPGPSVLALLTVSTGLAILILGVVWFVFFRTYTLTLAAITSKKDRAAVDAILKSFGPPKGYIP